MSHEIMAGANANAASQAYKQYLIFSKNGVFEVI